MAPLDGCFRLETFYTVFGRPARMVFTFRRYDLAPPTFVDCQSVAQQYGLWENNGAGVGYALLRGQDSYFNKANAYSIDSRSRALFADTAFSRQGQLPDLGSSIIPSAVAPVIRWVVDGIGGAPGRTYCVGVAQSTIGLGADGMTVTPVVADDLITQFRLLIPPAFPASVAGLVHVSKRRSIVGPAGVGVFPVLDSAMPTHRMGTQVRRGPLRSSVLRVG